MSDHIPKEILENIFKRLPVKILVSVSMVCKSWKRLISSSEFCKWLLGDYLKNDKSQILVRHFPTHTTSHYALHDQETFDVGEIFDDKCGRRTGVYRHKIVDSCGGVLCLVSHNGWNLEIILWNPSIKKWLYLPSPVYDPALHRYEENATGFGYDIHQNEFKVIHIKYLVNNRVSARIEIFRLNHGVWQDLSHLGLNCLVHDEAGQAFVNGMIHWVAKRSHPIDRDELLIISFNVAEESFGEIALSSVLALEMQKITDTTILVFDDSIGVVKYCILTYDVWIMNKYGDPLSWTKTYTIDVENYIGRPLLVRNSELLFGGPMGLVSCVMNTNEIRVMGIIGFYNLDGATWAGNYVESLALLDKLNNEPPRHFFQWL